MDKKVYIANSAIPRAGKGLFARVPLAKGETLEVVGALVPAKSAADRCTRYADAYKFRIGKFLLIPTGYGGIVNHSSAPNMEKVTVGRRLYLRALRRIEKGEELVFVYSEYAQKKFKLSRGSELPANFPGGARARGRRRP